MTAQERLEQRFYDDFKEFWARHRDVYIEVWTPEDFGLPWGSRAARQTAMTLADGFDAERGTTWPRIEVAVDAVTTKGS